MRIVRDSQERVNNVRFSESLMLSAEDLEKVRQLYIYLDTKLKAIEQAGPQ